MIKKIIAFFDNLEDKVRNALSTMPIVYAALASVGTVLLWRGIWVTADNFSISGSVSIVAGVLILLMTGLFVSGFIGNRILLTGMRKEKKLAEKTIEEVEMDSEAEKKMLRDIKKSLNRIEREINPKDQKNL